MTVMAGVIGYFLLQAIEVWVFPRALIQQRMAHTRWRTAALAVVAVNGVIFGSVGIVAAVFGGLRWRRFSVQFGGLAKVGSGSDYAASLCSGLALSGASPG